MKTTCLISILLLLICGCDGSINPCGWLPRPNQEIIVEVFQELRFEGYTRSEVLAQGLLINGLPNIFDPDPTEFSLCVEQLVDRAYGG